MSGIEEEPVNHGTRLRRTAGTLLLAALALGCGAPQGEPTASAPPAPGTVNPAAMQLDFYIRSPENNDANHPNREVFDHFFAIEVTWR